VRDLRSEAAPFPPVLFFTMSPPGPTRAFLDRAGSPDARAVADPEKVFYAGFGLERGGLWAHAGPRAAAAAVRALLKGNAPGKIEGDAREMSGFFLVRGERVLWRHVSRFMGDHPAWSDVRRAAQAEKKDRSAEPPRRVESGE
jgi:hypothetical protein